MHWPHRSHNPFSTSYLLGLPNSPAYSSGKPDDDVERKQLLRFDSVEFGNEEEKLPWPSYQWGRGWSDFSWGSVNKYLFVQDRARAIDQSNGAPRAQRINWHYLQQREWLTAATEKFCLSTTQENLQSLHHLQAPWAQREVLLINCCHCQWGLVTPYVLRATWIFCVYLPRQYIFNSGKTTIQQA